MEKGKGIIHVAPSIESWKVPGVVYRGKTGAYEFVGEMVPAMTQEKQMEKYGVKIPSAPLFWAIADRAYELRNENPDSAETLRSFLQQGLRKYPNTSSRIIYEPFGQDEIIHNYNTSEQYSLSADIVGSDGEITDIPDKEVLEALLETKDIDKINKVSNWINGTPFWIWRLNSRPKQKDERVARFLVGSGRLLLDCYRYLALQYPGFWVERIE